MNNLNRVIINGNLTTDCKLERGKSGTAYGGFCIAVNSSEKKDGEWVDTVSYFEVKAFGKLFESQHPYLNKGANVTVEGKLKQENWQTKEGEKRNNVPVVTVEENGGGTLHGNFRQRNEETGKAVEDKQRQIEAEPYSAAVIVLLIQEIQQELEVAIRQHHHTQQGNMMPEIDGRPKLQSHTQRAAVPQNHDTQHGDKGTDNIFRLFGRDEGYQQKEVAKDGYDRYPTISIH